MTTINEIMTSFQEIATDHYQINSSFLGQTWNYEAETNIYPCMIVITQPSYIQKGQVLYNFSIYMADIMNKDRTNLFEIQSDMFSICNDIVSELKDKEDVYNFWLDETNVMLTPFEESFDDIAAGWQMDITIQVLNGGSSCSTAFKTKNLIDE